ncbi:hypothetical protein GE21DRAFT_2988 [Neurospora crassa]|uniref:Uncharacterized protein n=1 Tax=Neurospora crassa (strain ATCC 24698 / 74-OR23-1A / CBS 708.71 / DSM 1257 / FGSC 987) TaxID=367110 RepID=V5IQY9_NEUCR|nr:hypothetical protein NCU05401 [Neurospora crassa OR74A]pir/T51041/ hypothetical protein B15I20.110 [imported] - Neurospora crassa [Neurospora crassa]ESA43546.1 hypothetical protein NCU05401 [Neurospora crassa OR74A]KHE85303.1 hypothetical protein GE21DRAFT_2988 [Neurospora crassa]|eukprot:XP_011393573.1 hypothetical protein NCU05401 [Neurospora crassa OR74A]
MPCTYITYLGASLGNMVTRGKIEASDRSDLSFLFLDPRKTLFPSKHSLDRTHNSHDNAVFSYPFVSPRCEPVTPAPWPTLRKKKNNGDDQWQSLLSTCSPLSFKRQVSCRYYSNVSRASRPSSTKWLEVLCARWCGTGIPARFCDTLQMICWLGRLMSLPILNPRALLR